MTEYYDDREHRCELLVRIIQSREGNPTKDERERAFEELLEMFRPLIKSIASRVYRGYRSGLGCDFDTFYHDTISTAVEMVLEDYVPKKHGGKAMFAPYLQSKLYFRTLWRAQKTVKSRQREFPMPINMESGHVSDKFERSNNALMRMVGESTVTGQVEIAILAQVTNTRETVYESFSRMELTKRIDRLATIARKVLDADEFYVWHGTLFSELQMNEIASILNKNEGTPDNAWTKRRVFTTYHKARERVLAAFGELALAGEI